MFTGLVRVARPEEGNEDTRKRANLDELGEEANSVVKELVQARLLVTGGEETEGESNRGENAIIASRNTIEVAHEALLRS